MIAEVIVLLFTLAVFVMLFQVESRAQTGGGFPDLARLLFWVVGVFMFCMEGYTYYKWVTWDGVLVNIWDCFAQIPQFFVNVFHGAQQIAGDWVSSTVEHCGEKVKQSFRALTYENVLLLLGP